MYVVRLVYVRLDHHACSSGVLFFMGNVQFEVVACTLNSLSKVETPIRDNIRELVI